jgi:NAD-dependent oxidoreductase involved in siderophore biosynthesis
MLQAFYPERMGVVMLVNTPWLLKSVWRAINPLLDERTRKKIRFLDSTAQIQEYVPSESLPRVLGGSCDWRPSSESVGLETLQPGWSFSSSSSSAF